MNIDAEWEKKKEYMYSQSKGMEKRMQNAAYSGFFDKYAKSILNHSGSIRARVLNLIKGNHDEWRQSKDCLEKFVICTELIENTDVLLLDLNTLYTEVLYVPVLKRGRECLLGHHDEQYKDQVLQDLKIFYKFMSENYIEQYYVLLNYATIMYYQLIKTVTMNPSLEEPLLKNYLLGGTRDKILRWFETKFNQLYYMKINLEKIEYTIKRETPYVNHEKIQPLIESFRLFENLIFGDMHLAATSFQNEMKDFHKMWSTCNSHVLDLWEDIVSRESVPVPIELKAPKTPVTGDEPEKLYKAEELGHSVFERQEHAPPPFTPPHSKVPPHSGIPTGEYGRVHSSEQKNILVNKTPVFEGLDRYV